LLGGGWGSGSPKTDFSPLIKVCNDIGFNLVAKIQVNFGIVKLSNFGCLHIFTSTTNLF